MDREHVAPATWQNALAVHTSTCCQRGKAAGIVESLEKAGLDQEIRTLTGAYQAFIELPRPFLEQPNGDIDRGTIKFTSAPQRKFKPAKEEVVGLDSQGPFG
jgi:hypothetical protein